MSICAKLVGKPLSEFRQLNRKSRSRHTWFALATGAVLAAGLSAQPGTATAEPWGHNFLSSYGGMTFRNAPAPQDLREFVYTDAPVVSEFNQNEKTPDTQRRIFATPPRGAGNTIRLWLRNGAKSTHDRQLVASDDRGHVTHHVAPHVTAQTLTEGERSLAIGIQLPIRDNLDLSAEVLHAEPNSRAQGSAGSTRRLSLRAAFRF